MPNGDDNNGDAFVTNRWMTASTAKLNKVFETCEVNRISVAIGAMAKAHNISELARISGITREVIHRSFAGRRPYPNFATTARLLSAMALRLEVMKKSGRAKNATRTSIISNIQGIAQIDMLADFLNDAFRSDDLDKICMAIRTALKSANIAEIARKVGIAESTLHRGFAGGGSAPNLTTIIRVLEALGLQLKVTPKARGMRPVDRQLPSH